MVTILIEELIRLSDGPRDGHISRIDFGERLSDSVKTRLEEPIA